MPECSPIYAFDSQQRNYFALCRFQSQSGSNTKSSIERSMRGDSQSCISQACPSHGRMPLMGASPRGVHLIDMYLTGMHLIGMHLICLSHRHASASAPEFTSPRASIPCPCPCPRSGPCSNEAIDPQPWPTAFYTLVTVFSALLPVAPKQSLKRLCSKINMEITPVPSSTIVLRIRKEEKDRSQHGST
jgi:hypothetical protein